MRDLPLSIAVSLAALLAWPLPAQETEPQDEVLLEDIRAFESWYRDYLDGAFRLVRGGEADDEALARVDQVMAKLAQWNTLRAAKKLFAAATVEPQPPGAESSTDRIDFYRELQPWKVQALARKHLCAMDALEIVPWLIGKLSARGVRSAEGSKAKVEALAVLRILGQHSSIEAQLELVKASMSMPAELRVQAVNAMAHDANLETVPQLLGLLRDAEPNVRIAAATSLGTALGPHVDETEGKKPTGELLKQRDLVITKLGDLLVRDRIWQVRSAAATALASLKCKAVIPVLIKGLKAELKRKHDPWSLDIRMHRILEGLTDQTVVRGDIRTWERFWREEGRSFAFTRKTTPGRSPPKANKYEKFFDLEIDSDRALFILDFSGSMAEPVTLKARTTGAKPGQPTTKAKLVVEELKKIVLSLPDGAMLNLVVFSDEVRVWREQRDGKPSLVRLDDDTRDDLLGSFLDSLHPQGPTNLYGAFDKALDFGGRGLYDKYYAAGFDTMYVLSDGAPSWGDVLDPDEIRQRVRETNGLRKIAINCVTFGDKNATDFLRLLAEENGGRHIHVE